MTHRNALCLAAVLAAALTAQDHKKPGYKDTPQLPDQKWLVHDSDRPHPAHVTPGSALGAPSSDAIVLFNGKDLSKWTQTGRGAERGKEVGVKWPVKDGYFECAPRTGDLVTKEKFGDVQLHIEWSEPPNVTGEDQDRGNSGVLLQSRYEIQVLESFSGLTYA